MLIVEEWLNDQLASDRAKLDRAKLDVRRDSIRCSGSRLDSRPSSDGR